jgi:hypothetical protein
MGALRLLVRRSLRSNLRGIVGLALVVALAGAVSFTALAAARRTASAFPRFLESSHASDLAVNIVSDEGLETELPETLPLSKVGRDLPGVVADQSYVGLESVVITDAHGGIDFDQQGEVVGSLDGRFLDQDRVAVREGRLPRPDRVEELFLNDAAATALRAHIGSTVHLAVYRPADLNLDPDEVEPQARVTVRVVGIGQFPDGVLNDDYDTSARFLATPALTARYKGVAGSYFWQGLRLAPGTSVDRTITAYRAALPDGYDINIQRSDVQIDRVQRSVHPVVGALSFFGLAAAFAALALGGLGALRLVSASGRDAGSLRALGLSTSRTTLAVGAPALLAVATGAIGAGLLAVALSPLAPVGPVRAVDPSPGLDLDASVLGLGTLALLLALGVIAVITARRVVGRQRGDRTSEPRPSRLVARVAALGLGPVGVLGTRHALSNDGSREGLPTRSTLVACTVSVVAVAAALTFGASVRSLNDTPAHFGWDTDLAVNSGGGYEDLDVDGAAAAAAVPGVDGLTIAAFAPMDVGGTQVNSMGILPVEGRPQVTVVSGRVPIRADEVALGATTSRALHRGLGDSVRAAGGPLRVVGIVALPAIGPAAAVHPSLGQGAVLTLDGLVAHSEQAYVSLALVHLAPGVDAARDAQRIMLALLTELTPDVPAYNGSYYMVQRPAEIASLQPASRTVYLLAGLLGVSAVLALGLSLAGSVRRRRATYAVLSALGFGRRDLRRTVRWQTNVVTAIALIVGLPLGIVTGRLAWTAFADQLGAAGGPQVPLGLLGLSVIGLIVLANLVGELPARAAGSSRAALLSDRTERA